MEWSDKFPVQAKSGIRQGDPLSPYLFILCLNHLSLALDQTLHTKHLSPIRLGRRPIGFNHVLFADDIFLFSLATLHDSRILFYIFAQFCQWSGQICNLSKYKIFFSRNATPEILHQIAVLTNMPIVTDLGKYQGLPLILNSTSNSMFQPLLDRIRDRIRAWQSILLSQAGRITLIKQSYLLLPFMPCKLPISQKVFLITWTNWFGVSFAAIRPLKNMYIC